METLRASVWRLSVLLTILGGVEAETLPTLTLQPLNYFTLPPPASTPAPSSPASFTTDLPDAPSETSTGQEDSQEDTGGEEAKEAVREPYFATPNTSVSVYLGAEVTLDCTLHDTANQSVSWLRSVDDMLVLLTWDSHIYSNDHRYSLVQAAGDRWQQWQLVIRDAQLDDQGQYRCQLATEPPMTLAITLNVIAPRARLVDERGTEVLEKHYKSGSMIELMCLIEQVPFPHGPVTWRRGTTVLTYNTSRGGIRGELCSDATRRLAGDQQLGHTCLQRLRHLPHLLHPTPVPAGRLLPRHLHRHLPQRHYVFLFDFLRLLLDGRDGRFLEDFDRRVGQLQEFSQGLDWGRLAGCTELDLRRAAYLDGRVVSRWHNHLSRALSSGVQVAGGPVHSRRQMAPSRGPPGQYNL
ncbi:uncharacterized protein [Procambarus clarkii]|uniref:uncharacterized protein isoform X2 n=1 Tax=Procambarus clarkii TaxID=6728 RepID=UPI0037438DD7